jgi:hypothetical protein
MTRDLGPFGSALSVADIADWLDVRLMLAGRQEISSP